MRVLVTGGAGYVGSVLIGLLVAEGHDVRVVDSGIFGISHLPLDEVELVTMDLSDVDRDEFDRLVRGIDTVFHLAAVSNDPSADLDPAGTHRLNANVSAELAKAASKSNARMVFASTAAIYGDADEELDESGRQTPLSHYAMSKAAAEAALLEAGNRDWHPIVLRMGTLFGLSPRMRFDLVVNIFGMTMATDRRVKVFGDGLQWRPYLHVMDAARAFMHFGRLDRVDGGVFNVSGENARVVDLVDVARDIDPGVAVEHVAIDSPDPRSYRMDTSRARGAGFIAGVTIHDGMLEVLDAVREGEISDPQNAIYRNASWLQTAGAAD